MDDINNVLIFVSDSLRWDFLPDSMTDRGIAFKTVAQSTYSPPSFTTLSTGLYPPQHGITQFGGKLPDHVKTTYHIPGVDGSYFNEGRLVVDALYQTYGIYQQKTVADLTPPFWHLERDTTTHAAFIQNPHFENVDVDSYYADKHPNWDAIRDDYRNIIRKSIDLLDKRIEVLERLGERENTLIVFTSDHGELFGEYDDLLHISPMSPELIYVPTVFIHPSLEQDDFYVDPDTSIIGHTDVVQTCLSAMGKSDALPTEGVNLLSKSRPHDYAYSHALTGRHGITGYEANGIWWQDSGYVRVENAKIYRLMYLLYKTVFGTASTVRMKQYPGVLRTYLKDKWPFGQPPLSEAEAMKTIDNIYHGVEQTERHSLTKEMESQLENLGYR